MKVTKHESGQTVYLSPEEVKIWAKKWPCSVLARMEAGLHCEYDRFFGLIDTNAPKDTPPEELEACILDHLEKKGTHDAT